MVKLLLKNRLSSLFSAFSGKGNARKNGKANYVVTGIVYLLLILMFGFISTTFSISLATVLVPFDAAWLYFSIFILAAVSVIFVFSIFETKAELFDCKDNELILAMPIKPHDIVASRIGVVLIYNYFVEAVIMLPAIIVYFVLSENLVILAGSLVVSLFIPLFATALSTGVGYAVAIISKKLKNNSFVILAISIAFLAAYFLGYGKLVEGMDSIFEADGEALILSAEKVPFLHFIGKSVLFSPLEFISVVIVFLLTAFVAYVIISKTYFNIITKTENSKKAVYTRDKSVRKSALYALTVKELRRFASSATYMLNGAIGFAFILVAGVAAVVKKSDLIAIAEVFCESLSLSVNDLISLLFVCVSIFMSSVTLMSGSALSLEGKNLWIPKVLPVRDREILLSKTLPQIIVSVPFTVISAIVIIIGFALPIKYIPFVIITPVIANASFAFLGSVINVLFPKFDYVNEAQVIKQSLSSFLLLLAQALISLGVIAIAVVFVIIKLSYLAHVIILSVFVMLCVLFAALLLGPLSKKYSKIEV